MRVALWTPSPDAAWVRSLAAQLGARAGARDRRPPSRASARRSRSTSTTWRTRRRTASSTARSSSRPGIVLLAEWRLHALVHAETAGRGDPDAYRREARRAHGDTGASWRARCSPASAERCRGLVAMNQRVLDASLALVAFDARGSRGAQPRCCPAGPSCICRSTAPGADDERRGARQRRCAGSSWISLPAPSWSARASRRRGRAEGTLAGLGARRAALAARELGLAEPPADAEALVAALFGETR